MHAKRGHPRKGRRRQAAASALNGPVLSRPARADPSSVSAAMLGLSEARHPARDADDRGSVQDPLEDWTEDPVPADEWLVERVGRDPSEEP